tara:strand:- start:30 stop:2186 length:2157 start_codon:yes stop_codon:yes gene_type:complete
MVYGAIIKAGAKALVKNKAKKIATDKLMGRGKKKDSSLVKSKVNKEIIGNMMGRKIGGDKGGADIPASQQTINVSPIGSDSPIRAGGGSGDVKIVEDISIAVSAIAESMKSGLVLKEKAQKKSRKAAEREKRAAQEAETERPDEPKKEGGEMPKFKVPGVGLLSGIFGFITKFIYGIVIMKLIEFLPKLKGLLGVLKAAGTVFNFLIDSAGFILNLLAGAVDFGYKLVDGAEKIVGKIFGEEGAEKFRTFIKNFTTLINSFLIFKILKAKVFDAIVRNIKNAFKFAKNIIKTAGRIAAKLFPNLAKGVGKIFQAGKGLVSKGIAKVGGFAAKIFGKAAGVISPALKGAKPFVSKFFGKVPIVGPLVVGIVSLLSGEPAGQAIFKTMGATVGGLLGSFIPIPIIGTLIGETIGVFVGDLLYAGLFEGGIGKVFEKLKDTFTTLFKGGKIVADWVGGGIKAFINNVLKTDPINVKEGFGVRSTLTKGIKLFRLYNLFESLGFTGGKDGQVDKFPNLLNILNPFKFYPLLYKSFFGKRDETSDVNASGGGTATNDTERTEFTTVRNQGEVVDGNMTQEQSDLVKRKIDIEEQIDFEAEQGNWDKVTELDKEIDEIDMKLDALRRGESNSKTSGLKPVIKNIKNTIEGRISRSDQNQAGRDAEAVASETTYESGEGNAVIIPLPSGGSGSPMITGGKRGRGSGVKVRTVVVDDTELVLYGGK